MFPISIPSLIVDNKVTNKNNSIMSKVEFITVAEFKQRVGTSKLDLVENPNTGKLFLAGDTKSDRWKVQGDLNANGEVTMLIPEEGITEACMINGKSDNVLKSF